MLKDKRLGLKLNGNRRVAGILRGFDPFMYFSTSWRLSDLFRNIVLDQAVETTATNEQKEIGMVVSLSTSGREYLIYLTPLCTKTLHMGILWRNGARLLDGLLHCFRRVSCRMQIFALLTFFRSGAWVLVCVVLRYFNKYNAPRHQREGKYTHRIPHTMTQGRNVGLAYITFHV